MSKLQLEDQDLVVAGADVKALLGLIRSGDQTPLNDQNLTVARAARLIWSSDWQMFPERCETLKNRVSQSIPPN